MDASRCRLDMTRRRSVWLRVIRRKREAWDSPRRDGMRVWVWVWGNAVDAVKSSLQHGDEAKMKHDVMYVCMR